MKTIAFLPFLLLAPPAVAAAAAFVVAPNPPTSSVSVPRRILTAPSSSSSARLSVTLRESPSPVDVGDALRRNPLGRAAAACILSLSILTSPPLPFVSYHPPPAQAAESRVVGEIAGSGLVFKDTLVVESFDDPKIKGVTLYVSSFQRPLTERIQKNFFSEPGTASVGCAKTGPIVVADNIETGKGGEEVFKESKSFLFKSLRVQRIYDGEKKVAIYESFNTRLDKSEDGNKSRFKSSTCAVALD